MDNTDKLLRAFIDASGYTIEEVEIPLQEIKCKGMLTLTPVDGAVSIDYKVTKKGIDDFIEYINDAIHNLAPYDNMYKDNLRKVKVFLRELK